MRSLSVLLVVSRAYRQATTVHKKLRIAFYLTYNAVGRNYADIVRTCL